MSQIALAVASPRRPLLDSLKKKKANEADDDVVEGSAGWCPGVDGGVEAVSVEDGSFAPVVSWREPWPRVQ